MLAANTERAMANPKSTFGGAVGALLSLAVPIVGAWFVPAEHGFWALQVGIVAFMASVGLAVTGRPSGILVTERNQMSLSRLQAVLWTTVVVAAFGAAVIARLRAGIGDPLAVEMPKELLMVMGIATTSLVGTPLVLDSKSKDEPSEAAVARTAKALEQPADEVRDEARGTVYANPDPSDAAFSDMFEGDEVGNAAHVDLGKVQMFFFTIMVAGAYVAAVTALLRGAEEGKDMLASLPQLSASATALLGISHAAYLGAKSVDHSSKPD